MITMMIILKKEYSHALKRKQSPHALKRKHLAELLIIKD